MKKLIILIIANAFALISFAQSISYQYDYLGRVSLILYPNGQAISYNYDAAGNRIFKENNVPCGLIPSPTITADGQTFICQGDSVTLSAALGTDITYQWRRNGQDIAGATNVSYEAKIQGSYKVVITRINGCIDSSNAIPVSRFPQPSAGFTINDTLQCLNANSFIFNDTSTISGGPLTRLWNFGDGSTSTLVNPVKTYLLLNPYSVKLISISAFGCKDSITKTVYLTAPPLANITALNPITFCAGGNTTLVADTATGFTYQWRKDGTDIQDSVGKSYTSGIAGVYSVVITNSEGCKDTSNEISIGVNPLPSIGFTINDSTQCLAGNNFIFNDTTQIGSGTLTRFWNFGNGDTSSAVNPSTTYLTANFFLVKMVSTSSAGCKDSITKRVTVYPPPTANINSADTLYLCPGETLKLSADTGSGFTFQWKLNGSNISGANASSYTAWLNGIYKVVVTNANNCFDSSNAVLILFKTRPNVGFTVNNPQQCLTGNGFQFNDTTSNELGRKWYLGTGDTSVIKNPSKTFGSAGTYTIKLVATGSNGCRDSVSNPVTVNPHPTVAFSINDSTQCLTANNFIFTDNSTISPGTLTRLWDFGNGDTSTLITKNITYTNTQNYFVKLVSQSNFGCRDSLTKTATIFPSPNAGFTISNPAQCLRGNSFIFTDTSTISSGTLVRTWNYGDATNGVNNPAIKTYTNPSTYLVTMVSISNNGCQSSVIKAVTVNPHPKSGFTINNTPQCLNGNYFIFNDTSTIVSGTISRSWDFGNGNYSILSNPGNAYSVAAIYNVKLVTASNYGCMDSISKMVTVNSQPGASISSIKGSGLFCINDSITMNSNTGPFFTYQWLENGSIIPFATQNKLNTKTSSMYQVIVTNNMSCADTSAPFITTIVPLPVAGNITGPLIIDTISIPVTYSIVPQPGHSYYWSLIGGNILSGQGTSAIYVKWVLKGNGRIRVKLFNTNNCSDTTAINVMVNTGIGFGQNFDENIIELYPNPVEGKLSVFSSRLDMTLVNIYDSRGRLVMGNEIKTKEAGFDVSELSAGMYLVEVRTDNGVKYFKVVKN
ncbi:MAG: PKD domain-containing protein [Bacteroidota bacterium]|nr:PKD domain-containing protein [Bacteroidota bacterium]